MKVSCFDTGRSSLYAILKTLGIGEGDEIIFKTNGLPGEIHGFSAEISNDRGHYMVDFHLSIGRYSLLGNIKTENRSEADDLLLSMVESFD